MSDPYEEIVEGESLLRFAPGRRHELICQRLHALVAECVQALPGVQLLPPRTVVQLSPGTLVRPDLALVAAANHRLWLAAEIVDSEDHRVDTVIKKSVYEAANLPRLWMVDPRYDNVEIYHASPYGLVLKSILAGDESLSEALLPNFQVTMRRLFSAAPPLP